MRYWMFLVALGVTVFGGVSASPADTLQVGVATVDITPPPGFRMSGYFRERLNTGTHDPLFAKALVCGQGETWFGWVACDLVGIGPEISHAARARAERETGIPAEHVTIMATHSHTGPLYFGAMRNHFHQRAVERHGIDPQEARDYAEELTAKLVSALVQARQETRPASLEVGSVEQRGISFNRRFFMEDGTVRFNPGKLNPRIVRPVGPIDPEVSILVAKDHSDGKPIACLTAFALHLDTVGGSEYSADYPLYLHEKIRERLGSGCTSLFAAGTCGDINHIDVSHDRPQKGQVEARRIGEILGTTVAGGLDGLRKIETPSLGVRSARWEIPMKQFTPAEIDQARRDLDKIGTREHSFLEQVQTYSIVDIAERGSESLTVEVQVFRLGPDAAVVALPGEVFVELGLDIKQVSPFSWTAVVELCNDAPGYLPTRKAFAEGSYETVNSRIQPGGGEALRDTAIRLLRELHDEADD